MRNRACGQSAAGFTIVELIVVIAMIVLILAIAVPGLNAVSLESRYSNATQTINGAMTRAYFAALSDMRLSGIRFVPGAWDFDPTAEEPLPPDRQHLVTLSYASTTAGDLQQPEDIKFAEYFQRREGTSSVQLPDELWVVPVEALDTDPRNVPVYRSAGSLETRQFNNMGADFVLADRPDTGPPEFEIDAAYAARTGNDGFVQADDFTVIFDPQVGLLKAPRPVQMKAYIPADSRYEYKGREAFRGGQDAASLPYRRYNFSGIAVYRREAFLAVVAGGASPAEQQEWLRNNARPYLVHRVGGGLVLGQGAE